MTSNLVFFIFLAILGAVGIAVLIVHIVVARKIDQVEDVVFKDPPLGEDELP